MSGFTSIPPQIEDAVRRADGASRRDFLKTSGLLVISFSAVGAAAPFQTAQGPGPYPDPNFRQLDTWIVIREDNTATFFVGKTDLGQGTGTAFRQIMADELDMSWNQTSCVMGSTDVTPDQGGAGGSDALQVDGYPMRRVSAEARRVLLEMASARLGVPVPALSARDGVVSVTSEPSRQVTYGQLVGGGRFNITLTGDNATAVTGAARIKDVQDLRWSGQPLPRYDIPAKVDGSQRYAVDVKLPGMVHARNVKPPFAGATLTSVDESSVRNTPGFVQVVRRGNYLAVVCEREEQAIRAASELRATWTRPASAPFPASEDLFAYMRSATPTFSAPPTVVGAPDAAFQGAAQVVEAEYEVPFQGHVSLGPAHATADPSNDQMTIYSNDMKSYGMRDGIAAFLQMPRDRVRVVWMEGSQAYGRTAADDAGFEAAFIAREIGRPVRLQWMRHEETGWDTKAPAYVVSMRGGLDPQGNLSAYSFEARAADHHHVGYNEHDTVLIAQLTGMRRTPNRGSVALPSDMYAIPNRRNVTHVVGLPLVWETPLRTGNLRDPNGPQVTFASESFIDELAVAAGADPIAFRLKLLEAGTTDDSGFKRARSIAVIRAAAEAYGWDARVSPKPATTADVLSGRGVSYTYRNQTVVAQIADVEVNRRTGRVWVKRLVCAHDCGLVVNPSGARATIECGMLHSLSRSLYEEVTFDTQHVTSLDWASYPTLRHTDAPERIDILLVNGDPNPTRQDLPMYGAGETVCKPLMATVANAIFDATGVRLRRVPFKPERVLAALKVAGL